MINNKFLYYKHLESFVDDQGNGLINNDSIAFIEDAKLIWTHGSYFGLNNLVNQLENRVSNIENALDGFKHVILTQEQYDALEVYDPHVIYLIVDSIIEDTWTFGDNFPITLT